MDTQLVTYHPKEPLLIWDGDCGFCKYWVLRMQTPSVSLNYLPYQEVGEEIEELTVSDFREKAWLIEPDGTAYSGAGSIFRVLWHNGNTLPYFLYAHIGGFKRLCDQAYRIVAENRPLMFHITKLLWGPNPKKPKNFWVAYLVLGGIGLIFLSYKGKSSED